MKMTMPSERNQEIHALRQSGVTQVAIAERYRLSRERVRQICLRVDRWLVRVRERDRQVEEANLAVMANESVIVGFSAKLDAITDQLDDLEIELREITAAEFDPPTNVLVLSVRSANCIRSLGIATVGNLLRWSKADLLRMPNMGRKSVREIQDALAGLGYELPIESRLTPKESELMVLLAERRWDAAWPLMRDLQQSGSGSV